MDRETIMIVEDEEGIREITQMYLLKKGYNVVTAENGEQALEKIRVALPTLILLDIGLPGKDGFQVCREIRKTTMVPIIFLSVRRGVLDKIKSFELGGDDYLTKPFDFIELEARIKANIRRTVLKRQNILKCGELEIHLNNYTCYVNNKAVSLSRKEMEILIHLAKNPNRVWSHEQLYHQIWDHDALGNIDTVKVHISNLRRKLEKDQKRPRYIKTVRGFGYQFTELKS